MKFFSTAFLAIISMLSAAERKRAAWIIAGLALCSLLDFFSFASLVPILYLAADQTSIADNRWLQTIRSASGLESIGSLQIALISGLISFSVLKLILSDLITRRKASFVFDTGSNLASEILGNFYNIPHTDYAALDLAKQADTIANQPVAFANNLIMPMATVFSEGLVLVLLIGFIVIFNPAVFVVISLVLLPVMFLYLFGRNQLKATGADVRKWYSATLRNTLQSVEGLPEIKTSGKENFFKQRFLLASKSLAHVLARDNAVQARTSRITELMAMVTVCALALYAVVFSTDPRTSMVLIAVYGGFGFRIIPSINRILHAIMQMKTHEHLLSSVPAVKQKEHGAASQGASSQFLDSISLADVSFHYPGQHDLLKSINITIRKGQKVALVGRSGTGKTTLLLVILRMLTAQHGSVFLDGRDSALMPDNEWRNLFAYVPQSPYLLDGSLAENIAFGEKPDEVDSKRITQLIDDLDLTKLVEDLPDGLSTRIGEKGILLSGGQRQRVAIARALYSTAPILLLDEITSQVDQATEREIMTGLQRVIQDNRTILMITHHEGLLGSFDAVVDLDRLNTTAGTI